MLDGRVLGASQVEYKPFGKLPLKREVKVLVNFAEGAQTVSSFKFAGQGQQETWVGDLRTTLLVVLFAPSRVSGARWPQRERRAISRCTNYFGAWAAP